MMSTAAPIILFAGAIWGAYACAGFYGVAIGASAMMATTALQLAIDAFGPIADNAGGIAEMAELDPEVRERTDILDAVGNTTAAVGKGFAIASAALTALALFAAYVTFTGIDGINIFKAKVLAALFIGGMIPVVFSAMAMSSVGKAAMAMVKEVRRQFKEIPGIMKGESEPEYEKCVDISTKAALKEMMLPGLVTIVSPIIIGFAMGAEALGSYMAGVTVSGVLWAIFQNNAGGAWDNAKKSFEAGVEIDGEMTFKGSDAHKAAVTGDTVGDPFKDTSGPSMNILIKLTCLVGLVIAPILGGSHHDEDKTLPPPPPKQASIQKNCEKKCCSMKSDKELLVFVDMDTKQSDTSVLNITSISGEDTLTNEVITVAGDDLDIDSIVNLAKEKANRLFKTSADCKKPCCMGCKATDTLQLAASCLADHSCCNPSFK
jgi:K(+)-stimulated pyrophosphate-energized sodium pump